MSLLPEINQASAEINKLVAQANIHQTIAPVNPAAFTDPADTMLLASRDPVIREVSVGMTGVEAASYTVSGTPPLSLPNSLGKPLKAWSVDLLPYQEGTGDPAPDNVRPIHGTDKLNLFVEESYDQSATPKAVLTLPQTVYTGTIGSEGGESRWAKKRITAFSGVWGATGTGYAVYVMVSGSIRTYDSVRIMCDKFKYSGNGYAYMPLYSWSGGSGVSETYSFVLPSTVTSLAEANQWIADNGGYIEFTYKLVTPTQFAVTTPTILTPTGTATTWATAEDGTVDGMEVTYVGKA